MKKNPIIEKIEKLELKIIKKGELITLTAFIIVIIAALINYFTKVNLYPVIYIGTIVCFVGIGFTLYIRYVLGNWKR
ncbi:hypothetical protein [Xenorhabdus sp. KJ12.1]|uniref:hypothetical protein n=1 Tax=Xenorhabdus sp. KJ12.1 TaxID=1851571 RepID=UPI000C049B21|nr:hypothetical protein [Xenorhabdus sp. KJ12.1]PHM72286.1 hypothetical protein Xekj_00564 [Xenorhabdus sp. KJ12.1]